jgi:hypothetical protein
VNPPQDTLDSQNLTQLHNGNVIIKFLIVHAAEFLLPLTLQYGLAPNNKPTTTLKQTNK